jgi:hypothetical protein
MNKLYIILGVLALLLSFASAANAEVNIVPVSQPGCCESVMYTVTVSNNLKTSQVFELSSEADDGLTVLLNPDVLKLESGEEEQLQMIVKPDCTLSPGSYAVIVEAEYTGACENVCGEFCTYSEDKTVTVIVPDGCFIEPEPPEEVPETEVPEDSEDNETGANQTEESPTGAVAAGDDYLAIGMLFILLGVFIVILLLIQRASKAEEKTKAKTKAKKGGKK